MWARMQEMAIRMQTPRRLHEGDVVNGWRVRRALPPITGNRRYLAVKDWRLGELRQFYDVNTDAFLRWQHQARLATLPHVEGLVHAEEEWSGGIVIPDPRLASLQQSAPDDTEGRVRLAAGTASLLAGMHEAGMVHHDLHPGAVLHGREAVLLRHLGRSSISGIHDFWTRFAGCRMLDFAAPEQLQGQRGGSFSDVYAFGMILHHLFGAPPYARRLLRAGLMGREVFRRLQRLLGFGTMPPSIREIADACLESAPENRPDMREIAEELDSAPQTLPRLTSRRNADALRVMAFVTEDAHTSSVLARARELGSQGHAVLIVSLVPLDLATGEMEGFKIALFKRLCHGLRALREASADWGLLLIDNADPAQAARRLYRGLYPDAVICGPPSRHGLATTFRPGVRRTLERLGAPFDTPFTLEAENIEAS